jgi:hypothetical protein
VLLQGGDVVVAVGVAEARAHPDLRALAGSTDSDVASIDLSTLVYIDPVLSRNVKDGAHPRPLSARPYRVQACIL